MSLEEPLPGGTHAPIVRVGDTVRRTARPATPAIHALLRHLERAGFDGAPRAIGLDERGREVLSYVPGVVVGQRGGGPYPAFVRAEATLLSVARLLRRYHDATLGFVPPPDAAWAFQVGAPRDGEVVCHNDVGPWNTVFMDGEARARAFCDAYGLDLWPGILATMARRIEVMLATGMALHAAGDPAHDDDWLTVMRHRLLRDLAFVRSQPPA